MSNIGWREVVLGDVIRTNLKNYSNTEKWDFVNYLDTSNITENKIDEIQNLKFNLDKIPSRAKRKVNNGDIVYSTVRPNQKHFGVIKNQPNNFLVSTGFTTIQAVENLAVSEYIYWFLSQNRVISYLQGLGENSASTYPSIKPSDIESLKINLPPLPTQKAIAKILGDLDAKIVLNLKMNESLEAMAQSLFQSWFVDFDPVIDNFLAANNNNIEALPEPLRKKGLLRLEVAKKNTLEINELFPDSFVFNEVLGKWIPEGWGVKTIDDCATVVGGGTPSTKVDEYFCENGIAWLSPKDLSGYNWKYISKGAKDITNLGLQKSSAKLMPAGTVLFSSRAPIGYIAIAENEVSTNQGFKSLIPNKGLPTEYLFQFLKQNSDKIESVATGSTFKEVSGSALKSIPVIVPNKNILDELVKGTKEFNAHLLVNQKQTQSLTKLRDTLLPQLISRKLAVPAAMLEVVVNN